MNNTMNEREEEPAIIESYNNHYILTRSDSAIIEGWSDGPHSGREVTEADILINDKGGYQFRLFPDGEENPALFGFDYMIPLYRWTGAEVVMRAEDELEAERAEKRAQAEAAERERRANAPEARITALEDALCEADAANEEWKASIEDALCEISAESEG